METWFIITVSLCISAFIKLFFSIRQSSNLAKLPPGPTIMPIIGSFLWLRKSYVEIGAILHQLKLKYGPIITLKIGSHPSIFIASHASAHRALVQAGAVFSDRPPPPPTNNILDSYQHNISAAFYGPNWRLFRRNMAETIMNPVRVKTFSGGRRWALGVLIQRLLSESRLDSIQVADHLQHAMFCLLVFMCFGEKFEDEKIREIVRVQRNLSKSVFKFSFLNIWPKVGRIVFKKKWKELIAVREDQNNVLIPIIKTRLKKGMKGNVEDDDVMAYVDSLVDFKLPEEGNRKLRDEEMVSMCGEFINAGIDTTSTTLLWIMANLVKYPQIQEKLYQEIVSVVGEGEEVLEVVKEEELQKMSYLRAVVLEGLRRHPPGHFVLPHSVTEDAELDGYVIPKNATVHFMVAEMGRDGEVWKDPMEFRPERFLSGNGGEEGFDVTCRKEIKMMPFGAGRRICPANTLALLHLEYFVANLIWKFEWKPAAGNHDVDLSEKQEFTIGMKYPLVVSLSPRVSVNHSRP
ncbi:hypothetical protein DCAR_0625967 [Daucus carota subsp. sativus]|uniref:Uncharacterized protein n=1 Tax=Daucus carota subsp. sativus TaxID=79200 RepID=A0A164WSW4_DAUCS|nr:PREDICTED: cytochrome P450 89A2-like [Daucus carota subsp. sativus]WOH06539.1 hypothetical protein DCAR_0625967 [Daucus carota subsp. sativus]